MPWWSWLIIWTVPVLALFGMLAVMGVILFRKLMKTVRALEHLGGQFAALEVHPDENVRERFTPSILLDHGGLIEDVELHRAARARRRQLRRDRLIDRSKLLANAPLDQRTD